MRKVLQKSFAFILALFMLAAAFSGCGSNYSKPKNKTNESLVLAPTEAQAVETEVDLLSLHYYDEKSDDKFAGAWTIADGVGSDLKSFVFMFDGHGKSYLMVGSTGYIDNYSVRKDDKKGEVFETKLMFGLNGTYNYEFADGDKTLKLINTDDNSVTELKKMENYNYIPAAGDSPVIDEELIGTWTDDKGSFIYFDKQGIMYETLNGINFTIYNYTAEKGEINATYFVKGSENETMNYIVDGNKLTLGNYSYTKTSNDKLV